MPPPYHSTPKIVQNGFDTNMNATIANKNHTNLSGSPLIYDRKCGKFTNSVYENYKESDEINEFGKAENSWVEENMGFDFQSILSMEILENSSDTRLIEARNDEVLKRVTEMQKLVENSEQYLNEQGELGYKNHSKMNGEWLETNIDKLESDNESSQSRISSLDDNPGKLKHSDSLILLTETINQGLNGINDGLNSILPSNKKPQSNEDTLTVRQSQGLSAILNNCGLTDALLALNNDLSQSESDNDSLYTPTNSPIHRHQAKSTSIQNKAIRTSFGLHSPDNPLYSSQQSGREQNLRDYLNQLRENANNTRMNAVNTEIGDTASSETQDSALFNGGDLINMIDLDPDLIDLTLLPPPQTPDELDSIAQVPQVIASVPASFADESEANERKSEKHNAKNAQLQINGKNPKDSNLDEFLATVVIEPPTLKVTPAVELTPEEIMSFIIPPPPVSSSSVSNTSDNVIYSNESQIIQYMKERDQESSKPMCNGQVVKGNVSVSQIRDMFNAKSLSEARNSLIINEKNIEKNNSNEINLMNSSPNSKRRNSLTKSSAPNGHVIDYPTVERKSVFSCCAKDKSKNNSEQESNEDKKSEDCDIKPPPRCKEEHLIPPERPPKSLTVVNSVRPRSNSFTYNANGLSVAPVPENRFNTLNSKKIDAKIFTQQNGDINHELTNGHLSNMIPPCLPPRGENLYNIPPHILLPPKKPPLPPVPSIETLKMKAALKHPPPILKNGDQKVASIGSPHFLRNQNFFKDIELEHQSTFSNSDPSSSPTRARILSQPECVIHTLTPPPSSSLQNKTGHVRSHSETKNTILKNKEMSAIFSLCSPQMNRKFTSATVNHSDAMSDRGLSSSSFNASDSKMIPTHYSTLRHDSSSPHGRTNHVRFKDQVDFNCSTLPSPILKQKLNDCGVGGNGHVVSVEILLQKTEVAVDGLLSRLHQVAQTCSHQHAQGGGEDIDERKFQVINSILFSTLSLNLDYLFTFSFGK